MTRTDTPPAPDERTTLFTMLDYVRETAIAKTEGLDEATARTAPLPTSPLMAPASVLNHLMDNERYWIEVVMLGGEDYAADAEPDSDFSAGLTKPLSDLVAEYRAMSRRCDQSLGGTALDAQAARELSDFHPNLRWVLLHLIEETARHNGHLDILRELADGTVGT